jgi:uncharacterized protein YacL
MADTNNPRPRTFDWRDFFGFASVVVGVGAIVGLIWIFLLFQKSADDTIKVIGAITSPIVAIVSAYFGISAATKGQSQVLAAQKDTSDTALSTQKDTSDKAYAAALAVDPGSDAGKKLTAMVPPQQS